MRSLFLLFLIAQPLFAQTDPVRSQFRARTVWGSAVVHIVEVGEAFKATVETDVPAESWQLLQGTSVKPMAKGRLNKVFKFEIIQATKFSPDMKLLVLMATESGVKPIVVRFSTENVLTGKNETTEPEMKYRADERRPYGATVMDLYKQAVADHRVKDYASARLSLVKALELDPGNKQVLKLMQRVEQDEAGGRNEAWVGKARRQYEAGEGEFAIETLDELLKTSPGFKPALDLREKVLGSANMKLKVSIKRSLALASKSESAGDLIKAEKEYRRVIEMEPENEEAANGLKRVTSGLARASVDQKPAKQGTVENIEKADRAYNLGMDCYRKGDLEGAKKFWEETLSYQSGHFQAKRNLERLAGTTGVKK